jgi:hypothetical protein
MDISTDILIVLGIGLTAILLCVRLLFWTRRWRASRWLDQFARSFADLERKSHVCTELSYRFAHSLSKRGHRDLYEVSVFISHIQEMLPEWRKGLGESSSTIEVDELCDEVERTLAGLTHGYELDPIDVMLDKLRGVALELATIEEHCEREERSQLGRFPLISPRQALQELRRTGTK